jgi:capsular exopolysaccharide synthesis family protein
MSLAPHFSEPTPARIDERSLGEEFFKYVGILRRGWHYVAVMTLVALTLAALYLFQLKPEFKGWARLLILHQGGRPLSTVVSGGKDPFDTMSEYDDTSTHIMVIRSPAILERALGASGLRHRPLEEVEQRLRVTRPDPAVKILEIGYQAATAEDAVKIVDAVVASYKRFLEDNYQKNTADVIALIAKVRDELSEELADLERKYLDFHRTHPVVAMGSGGRSLLARRLDQWDDAANESMLRAVKLQAQLDLARQLERQGAGLTTISTTLRYLCNERDSIPLAGLADAASDHPAGQLRVQLAEAERQRRMAERLLEHLRALQAAPPASRPVSEPEVAEAFNADPEVVHLREQLALARARCAAIQRVARSARDPSLVHAQRSLKALLEQVDELWQRRRPVIIDLVGGGSNAEIAAAIRREEANVIALRSRESVLREELERSQPAASAARTVAKAATAAPAGPRPAADAAPAPADGNQIQMVLDTLERGFKANEAMRAEMTRRFQDDLAASKEAEIERLEEENLRASLERQRTLFNSVVDQLKQAQLVSDHSTVTAQIVNPPTAAAVPSRRGTVLAVAFFLGCGLGIGCALVADLFDDRLRTLPALRRSLGYPVLGLIPQILRAPGPSGSPVGLISHEFPRSLVAEAYKSIRTRLDFHRKNGGLQVLSITSPSSGDGKSTSACNLAISMAHAGRKVLLVDADLRRPSLHHSFKLSRSPGLVQVLEGREPSDRVIQPTPIENLDLITSGPDVANPAELLASPRFSALLAHVRPLYDTIVIDSSPLLAVADPLIIGSAVDGVILIARVETLHRRQADRTSEMLPALGTPVLGTVINGIKREHVWYTYGYDFGYDYNYTGPSGTGAQACSDVHQALEQSMPASSERVTKPDLDALPLVEVAPPGNDDSVSVVS